MKRMILLGCVCTTLLCCCSCRKELIEYRTGDLRIAIEPGSEWLHDFPLVLGIKKKNPPQVAVWLEDTAGNYLSTVYATHKIATCSWKFADGNRRKEALPHWCHARGVRYADGLYLPTREQPLTDGISGATPRAAFALKVQPATRLTRFVIKVEVNHSTDFNRSYPASATPGAPDYSGGEYGSGQPALVYAGCIDLGSGKRVYEASLIGHSSPDGSDGALYPDLSGLTTAPCIVQRIRIELP